MTINKRELQALIDLAKKHEVTVEEMVNQLIRLEEHFEKNKSKPIDLEKTYNI